MNTDTGKDKNQNPIRILYIATSFPEPDKGATIYTDLAEALYEEGHEITVAVSEQRKNRSVTSVAEERGFRVLRIVVGDYYDVGLIKKGIVTTCLPYIMRREIKKKLGSEAFDLILFETPPITNINVVNWAQNHFRCSSYLMLKDIFPQNAADLGILKQKGILFKYYKKLEKKLYRQSTYIGCMSIGNREYILKENSWLDASGVFVFPNTKKIADSYQCSRRSVRPAYGIPDSACCFMFGGNMGRPQNIPLLAEAVSRFAGREDIFFVFVGRGTERRILEKITGDGQIKNALILDNLPREDYEQLLKECDVGLITLDPRFTIPNYPSRILSYMEYGKPVIAATDRVTDIRQLIEESLCGKWCCSDSIEDFVLIIESLAADEEQRTLMGVNGRQYLEKNFDVKRSVELLINHCWRKSL